MNHIKKELVSANVGDTVPVATSTGSSMNRNVQMLTSCTEDNNIDDMEVEKRLIERKRMREDEESPNSDQSSSSDCVTGHKLAMNQISSEDSQKRSREKARHRRSQKRRESHQEPEATPERRTGDSDPNWNGKRRRFYSIAPGTSKSSSSVSISQQHGPLKPQSQPQQQDPQQQQTARLAQCDQKDPKAVEWETLLHQRPINATKEEMAAWLMDVLAVSDKRAASAGKVTVISSANDDDDNSSKTSEAEGESDIKSSSSSGPTDQSGLTGTSRTDGSSADDSSSTTEGEKNPNESGNGDSN